MIASAAGETDLPGNTEQRLGNLNRLMPLLNKVGLCGGDVYIDPLVFPVATDSNNAQSFLSGYSLGVLQTDARYRFGACV